MFVNYRLNSNKKGRLEVSFKYNNKDTGIIKVLPFEYEVDLENEVIDDLPLYRLTTEKTVDKILEDHVRSKLKIEEDLTNYKVKVQPIEETKFEVNVSETNGNGCNSFSFTQVYDFTEFVSDLKDKLIFDETPSNPEIKNVLKNKKSYEKIEESGHDILVDGNKVYLILNNESEVAKKELGEISIWVRPISERLYFSPNLETNIKYVLEKNTEITDYQPLVDQAIDEIQEIIDMKTNLLKNEFITYRVKEVQDDNITVEVVLNKTNSEETYVLGKINIKAKLFVNLQDLKNILAGLVINTSNSLVSKSDINDLIEKINTKIPNLKHSKYNVSFKLSEAYGVQNVYYKIVDTFENKVTTGEIIIKAEVPPTNPSKPGNDTEVIPPVTGGGSTGGGGSGSGSDSGSDSGVGGGSSGDSTPVVPTPPAVEEPEQPETPDAENGAITETDKELGFESVGQVDKDGNVQSSYEITSDTLSKVFEEKKSLVLTDKTSGAQVELGSKAINPNELAKTYGKDVTVSVNLTMSAENTFKIEATAKGSLKEGKLEQFQDQLKITFDKKASKAAVTYNQEIAMQKVDGQLVHIPHQIKGNKVTVRTYNTGEIVLMNATIQFVDITNDLNKQSILDLGIRGIVKGVGNDVYAPTRQLTRAEFATMVARALGLKAQGENTFTDVKQGWYYDSVIALTEANLIKGVGNNKFQPNSYITGEEIAVIMHRIIELELGKVEINNQLAGDVSGYSVYAQEAIAGLRTVGISTGDIVKGKTFNRSQMAKLLADTMKKVNLM